MSRGALIVVLSGLGLIMVVALIVYAQDAGRSRAQALVRLHADQLHDLSFHDALTGLPNRSLVLDRIGQMLERSRRDDAPIAVLFVDLDDFRDINDSLGHAVGDQLLAAVAERLGRTSGDQFTIGRLGGDEFVVLVDGSSSNADPETVAAQILSDLRAPFVVPGCDVPLSITGSIGIATGDRRTAEELLRDADIARYRAKALGKECAVLFTYSMRVAVNDHHQLEVDLHRALTTGEFFLLYQPTVDLPTERVTGVEALLRWNHPIQGIVEPRNFVPALEAGGLIVPVGRWVLFAACRQARRWQHHGRHVAVSVNVAAAQLERDDIIDDVQSALTTSGLDPRMLTLELTESARMMDSQASRARLDLLRALGVRIALDEFGAGYSSMAHLQHLPIDMLKIDRTFVSRINSSSQSAALVHTLVQLGMALGIPITAEGIETEEQLDALCAEGVDVGQGYLFGKPLDGTSIELLLRQSRRVTIPSVTRVDPAHTQPTRWPLLMERGVPWVVFRGDQSTSIVSPFIWPSPRTSW